MPPDDPYQAFARPTPESVVTFRAAGPTVFATVQVPDVTSTEAPVLGDELHGKITGTDGIRHLVIDLGGVRFLNSTAIGVLVTAYTAALNRNAKLILAGVRDDIADLFQVTKLTNVLTVCTTPDELEAALAG